MPIWEWRTCGRNMGASAPSHNRKRKEANAVEKRHPTLGCCGIDCGLCPRFYTEGTSRCPGCGGEGFGRVHPSCFFLTCCARRRGLEVCAQCAEFPCAKFIREDGSRDSFVTHRRVLPNGRFIREYGLDAFLLQQRERMVFLEEALETYDDGRSKGLSCLAAALLTLEGLRAALTEARNGADLKEKLFSQAETEGVELKLRK